jgi:tetrahydromethanopterin S-methyltransferase subunit D
MAADTLPVVGEAGERHNILYTAGCSGHGVGTQSFVGQLLAARIAGEKPALLSALRHKTPRLPPEPLRWIAMKSAFAAANRLDARVNRKVRRTAEASRG